MPKKKVTKAPSNETYDQIVTRLKGKGMSQKQAEAFAKNIIKRRKK